MQGCRSCPGEQQGDHPLQAQEARNYNFVEHKRVEVNSMDQERKQEARDVGCIFVKFKVRKTSSNDNTMPMDNQQQFVE